MNHPVDEWIEKAEEDYRVALTLRRLRRHPTHNAVCFHAQQCVEKYLKAILEKQGAVIRKIHALPVLLDQCAVTQPLLIAMRPNMVKLSEYAVEFRYPGESATAADAAEAIRLMKNSRLALCAALNIAPDATPARAQKYRRRKPGDEASAV